VQQRHGEGACAREREPFFIFDKLSKVSAQVDIIHNVSVESTFLSFCTWQAFGPRFSAVRQPARQLFFSVLFWGKLLRSLLPLY
jgi:hypothetical protein